MSEATLTKAEPSSVIIERQLIYERSMQLLFVNFKRLMCLVIDSECSEGASRNPSVTDFPNESTTVVTIKTGTNVLDNIIDQYNVSKRPPLSEVIIKIPSLDL